MAGTHAPLGRAFLASVLLLLAAGLTACADDIGSTVQQALMQGSSNMDIEAMIYQDAQQQAAQASQDGGEQGNANQQPNTQQSQLQQQPYTNNAAPVQRSPSTQYGFGTGVSSNQQQQTQQQYIQQQNPSDSSAAAGAGGDDIMALHNNYRAIHHSGPLAWSPNLASSAQQWANQLSTECSFHHSGSGENLAAGYRSWGDVAAAWYNEIYSYSYQNPGYSPSNRHATQMLWASTTDLGCAVAVAPGCPSLGTVYVCHYNPPGNVNSAQRFSQNVQPV